ncbi:transcription factor A, mitochondrial [Mantella aurantiaca]
MVSLLSRGVGVLVKSVVGLSCAQAARCSSLPSALSATQCMTARWFSKDIILHDFPKSPSPQEPPKLPLTSFMRFSCQQRPLLAKQHPGVSVIELSKIIGREWRALSDDKKQVYVESAKIDLLKYRDLFKKYKESLDPLDLEILRERRKRKTQRRKAIKRKRELTVLGKPKRARNPFNIFVSENFHDAKGDFLIAKMKSLIHDWKNLSSSEKQVYTQLAEDDKVRYQNELKVWEEQMIEIGRADLVRYVEKTRLLKKKSADVDKRGKKKTTEPTEGRKRSPKKHEE